LHQSYQDVNLKIINQFFCGGFMQRIDGAKLAPGGYKAMLGLEAYLHECGLEILLLHLIKLRASQINGCAYCIDMHWKDARSVGDSEQRLYSLDAWRESPYYSERERAALAWTEAVTLITDGHAPDQVYEEVRRHFSEKELADLNPGSSDYQRMESARHRVTYRTGDVPTGKAARA
jgi:AhpD family alkylhydroperoxidase